MSLSDAALIKDNRVVAGGRRPSGAVREQFPGVAVEVGRFPEQLTRAYSEAGADLVLLTTSLPTRCGRRWNGGRARLGAPVV